MWNLLFSPAMLIHVNLLGCPLFHQLAHDGLKFLWKATRLRSRTCALVSAILSSSLLIVSYPGEWHTVGGRQQWHHTGAGRRGRGRSEDEADQAEEVGPAPARSSWCRRCMGIRFIVPQHHEHETMTRITPYQVFLTSTFRKSRRGTLMPFVATSLQPAQSNNQIFFPVLLRVQKQNEFLEI